MKECIRCKHKGEFSHVCDECLDGEMFEKKVITNADRIRSMTDEELYQVLLYLNREFLIDADKLKEWLKSEVGCE